LQAVSCIRNLRTRHTALTREPPETIHHLFVDFKKAYYSVRKKVLYNILIEFGLPMKLVRLIKMCVNETYSKIRKGKYLSDNFLLQNDLNKETHYRHCLLTVL
jgi:hypothetical protein